MRVSAEKEQSKQKVRNPRKSKKNSNNWKTWFQIERASECSAFWNAGGKDSESFEREKNTDKGIEIMIFDCQKTTLKARNQWNKAFKILWKIFLKSMQSVYLYICQTINYRGRKKAFQTWNPFKKNLPIHLSSEAPGRCVLLI